MRRRSFRNLVWIAAVMVESRSLPISANSGIITDDFAVYGSLHARTSSIRRYSVLLGRCRPLSPSRIELRGCGAKLEYTLRAGAVGAVRSSAPIQSKPRALPHRWPHQSTRHEAHKLPLCEMVPRPGHALHAFRCGNGPGGSMSSGKTLAVLYLPFSHFLDNLLDIGLGFVVQVFSARHQSPAH